MEKIELSMFSELSIYHIYIYKLKPEGFPKVCKQSKLKFIKQVCILN